jgi:transposase
MTVIIGIDPHKRSHTAVALGEDDQVLGELRVVADAKQIGRLQRFATSVAAALRRIRPADDIAQQRKAIAKELLTELRVLDRQRKDNERRLAEILASHGTTLTEIQGISYIGAATILSIVGDVSRFPTAAAFATFNGTAPIAASSGDKVRHRLNRGGHRTLNKVLHTAAKTQQRLPGPGRDYTQRRLAEGKTNAEATRALKRHLSNVVYRTLLADQHARVSGEDKRAA